MCSSRVALLKVTYGSHIKNNIRSDIWVWMVLKYLFIYIYNARLNFFSLKLAFYDHLSPIYILY